jgi:hypothetical protein
MKLLTIDCREIGGRPGVLLDGDDILDLVAAPSTLGQAQWVPYSVVGVLAAGREGLDRAAALVAAAESGDRDALRRDRVLLPVAGTALLPPLRRPGLLLVAEDGAGAYIKSQNTAVANGARVAMPWNDDAPLECSGMLAAVLGRPLYRANRDAAAAAIAGYMMVLDLSAPPGDDRQRYLDSKQFPGASPMGPVILTKDELADPRDVELQLSLNGVTVGADAACLPATDAALTLSELSRRYGFRPGDAVCFEPPPGAALRGHRLHGGDAVRLTLDGSLALDITLVS